MIDFLSSDLQRRLKNFQQENLIKALGKKNSGLIILDMTAGLGRDALLLAVAGNEVLAVEKSKELFEELTSALVKLRENRLMKDWQNISFLNANSIDFLRMTAQEFDVIYLDPMFPKTNKTGLAKREMQMLRDLDDEAQNNELDLFNLALEKTKSKVILKRPVKAPFITDTKPNYQIKGTISRFDVYISC